MMSNYIDIRDAIREIEDAFEREITRWYRIRRQAIRRGYHELAQQIADEIWKAKNQMSSLDLLNWPFGYKYLFRLDRPVDYYR